MKKFIVGAVLVALSGCANNAAHRQSEVEKIDSKLKVYAKLKKDDSNQYFFSEFSFVQFKDSVNLNDLTSNYDKRDVSCRIGLASAESNQRTNTTEICESKDDIDFRYGTVDGSAVFSNTLGNVVVAAVTMGLGTSAYYTSKFDHKNFNIALNSALEKQPREKIISEFNAIHDKYIAVLQQKTKELEKKRDELDSLLKRAVVVNDKTKMLESNPVVSVKTTRGINNSLGNIGTWKDSQELSTSIERNLHSNYSSVELTAHCENLNKYTYSVRGCEGRWGIDDDNKVNTVTFFIENVKNYRYYPVVGASNSHVIVKSSESGLVEFSNMTDSFLSIDSFSLYVGGKIETISNLGITLPPKSVNNEFRLSRFNSFENSILRNIKKDDLSKEIEVGLALKYRVVNTNMENTLYKVNNVKYKDLPGRAI